MIGEGSAHVKACGEMMLLIDNDSLHLQVQSAYYWASGTSSSGSEQCNRRIVALLCVSFERLTRLCVLRLGLLWFLSCNGDAAL